jgi:hypothetical protein
MCRWNIVDFMLICGISFFGQHFGGGVGMEGWKLSHCSLRLEFYELDEIEVKVCHFNGNLMRSTHVYDIQTQWFKMVAILCLVHSFSFSPFFPCIYVCQVVQLQPLEVRVCWFYPFSTLCCRICPASWFYGWHIPGHSPCSLQHTNSIPYRQQILPGAHIPGLPNGLAQGMRTLQNPQSTTCSLRTF